MTTISAESILASRHAQRPDARVDTLRVTMPNIISKEFLRHRVFSFSESSMRAVPVEKMIQWVLDDPFVPLFWGKNQKGMQAEEECYAPVEFKNDVCTAPAAWLRGRDQAVRLAKQFSEAGYHKQIANRLLMPFTHTTYVVTSTNWSNFLALRDHPDAEPHMQLLAKEIRKALDGAEVQTLPVGDWHLPFIDRDDMMDVTRELSDGDIPLHRLIKLSVARCASTSYKTVDGFDMTLERAIELHDKLVSSVPLHASPAEHVCQADRWNSVAGVWWLPKQHGNFVGFRQYRKMLPGECQ